MITSPDPRPVVSQEPVVFQVDQAEPGRVLPVLAALLIDLDLDRRRQERRAEPAAGEGDK